MWDLRSRLLPSTTGQHSPSLAAACTLCLETSPASISQSCAMQPRLAKRPLRELGLARAKQPAWTSCGPVLGEIQVLLVADHVTVPVQVERLTMTDPPWKSRCQLPLPLMYAAPSAAPKLVYNSG